MSDENKPNALGAGIAGGGLGLVGGTLLAQTELGQSISKTVANTGAGKAIGNLSKKVSNLTDTAGEAVTKGISKAFGESAGKAVGKAAASAGDAFGVGIDIVMGGIQIGESAQAENVPDDIKGYNITMDVISTAVNVGLNFVGGGAAAASAATGAAAGGAAATGSVAAGSAVLGPIALVVIAAQLVGALLDSLWNPFKNYFNSDLETMRLAIKSELKKAYNQENVNWPLEVKPDFLSGLNSKSPDYQKTIKEFQDYIQEYYDDKGLITKEAALEEENILIDIIKMKRRRRIGKIDENGNIIVANPDVAAVTMLDNDNNNMLMLIALAARVRRLQRIKRQKPSMISLYIAENKISVIISTISLIIFFFCCISIVSTSIVSAKNA